MEIIIGEEEKPMSNKKVITIAESINIMSKTIGPAIREKNKAPIQKMAVEENRSWCRLS